MQLPHNYMKSSCICGSLSEFTPEIVYKNESVFKEYEGSIIGKCVRCGILKTFPPLHSKKFNPQITKYIDYEEKRGEFEALFRPIVSAVKTHVRPHGRILDVGCSSGILLELLKGEGFDLLGLEPNKLAFKYAQCKLGKRVLNTTIKTLTQSQQFDCIIYNHVLEHISDTNNEISHIREHLAPQGVLIVGVPNTHNCVYFLRKKYWEYLLPNEHIWHFNTGYLTRLFSQNGFSTVQTYFFDDKRREYPLIKKIYFYLLSCINKALHTGEAVLLIMKKK